MTADKKEGDKNVPHRWWSISSPKSGHDMKLTIVYDNTAIGQGLVADWGFSCVVDAHGQRVLFDTGAKGSILLHNMQTLCIELSSIGSIFLSHPHWDHAGGLMDVLRLQSATVFVPACFPALRIDVPVLRITESCELYPGIFSTGELMSFEQAMIVEEEAGLVVVVGCSHPGVKQILNAAREHGTIRALVGGLHGFNEFDVVKNIDYVCPTHCTVHTGEIAQRFPKKFIAGGVGTEIVFERGRLVHNDNNRADAKK
jgi:7,8-dihydropterin-6-yl-methyl-4-(beta-D-ribofuranosyl)aminobenzene 5'-phosphate synthase